MSTYPERLRAIADWLDSAANFTGPEVDFLQLEELPQTLRAAAENWERLPHEETCASRKRDTSDPFHQPLLGLPCDCARGEEAK